MLLSHFLFQPEGGCHVLPCQFESQWSERAPPLFSHPVERALQFIALWHLPQGHQLYLEIDPSDKSTYEWLDRVVAKLPSPQVVTQLPLSRPIHLWGYSTKAVEWVDQRGAKVGPHPPLELIHKLHDKRTIEQLRGPLLPHRGGGWLSGLDQFHDLLAREPGQPWMVKRPLSSSGQGNLLVDSRVTDSLEAPAKLGLAKKLALWLQLDGGWIVQPFVKRLVDFSSLWWIYPDQRIELFGMTRMMTSLQGRYLGCHIADPEQLFADCLPLIDHHREQAQTLLTTLASMGYIGPIGLDGMIYQENCLDAHSKEKAKGGSGARNQPLDSTNLKNASCTIIEINARQTLAMHLLSIYRQQLHKSSSLRFQARLVNAKTQLYPQEKLLLPPIKNSFNIAIQSSL